MQQNFEEKIKEMKNNYEKIANEFKEQIQYKEQKVDYL